ncbi:MAG: hypothetical protein KGJ34_02470 [Patescibacteria group bacterium]|nr:hypothetical protein [Patescibacteria group bacterium]
MRTYLTNLHARPAHEKRRFSMRVAAVLTIAIFIIWLSTLSIRLAGDISSGSSNNTASSLVAATAAAGSQIQSQFGQIQSNFQSTQGGTSEATGTSASAPPANTFGGQSSQ